MNATPSAIALGANIGDPREAFRAALREIRTIGDVVAVSSVYITEPVGGPEDQPDFVNQVVLVTFPQHLRAQDVLIGLHRFEAEAGRTREVYWGPRTLDLDLLYFGDQIIQDETIIIPHPRMHERSFVLVPLVEVLQRAGWQWKHPIIGKTALELVGDLSHEKSPPVVVEAPVY